jgi:DNA-directed RNA polymerase subunit alpha
MDQEVIAKNWRELIRPRELESDETPTADSYGRFSCEPLERGFGTTLGNSLRRVLLSSLQGAAITSLKIEGVQHEFSTVQGVMEDVSDIVLNLKDVRLRMHGEGPRVLRLHTTGSGVLTAGDLVGDDSSVEVINPDQKVATLSDEADVEIEITVDRGKGYVPAEKNNFDKLSLDIWTDGTIAPVDALAYAAKILKEQLSIFINFEEPVEAALPVAEEPTPLNPNLFKSVDELELSVRSANCLQNANIRLIGELVQRTEAEMLKTKNFGRKSLNELKDVLGGMGLELGMKIDRFPDRSEVERMREREV